MTGKIYILKAFVRNKVIWYITDLDCRQVDIPDLQRHIKWFKVFHFTVQHECTACANHSNEFICIVSKDHDPGEGQREEQKLRRFHHGFQLPDIRRIYQQ
jgi:hypothetical protein